MLIKWIVIATFLVIIYFRVFRVLLRKSDFKKKNLLLAFLLFYLFCIVGVGVLTDDRVLFILVIFLGLVPVTFTEYLLIKENRKSIDTLKITPETIVADFKRWVGLSLTFIVIQL